MCHVAGRPLSVGTPATARRSPPLRRSQALKAGHSFASCGQDESDDDQDVAINLTANVLKVLRDEIEDASLFKRQISSPSKVYEIRERAVADAKSIADIANAFLDVPKYDDQVTNAVLQVCAEARFVKEAKTIVEEYFAMLDNKERFRKNDRQYYNYEQEMVPNVFKSMQYNRYVREEEKIEEASQQKTGLQN